MSVRILVGDAREKLREMADESVHCVVTSPPYWGLRAYDGDSGMIGLEETFEEHLENLVAVFREVRRVLRSDGTLWLNYGDAYAGSWGVQSRGVEGISGLSGGQVHAAPKGTHTGSAKRTPGLKPKDLMMMPARVAMALQADGWWLRSEIVWHKLSPMPESVTDRPSRAHEKLFLLSKSGATLFWTHRSLLGVRTQPPADHVYRNRDTGIETADEPANWRVSKSVRDPKQKAWQRVNLWVGHDYFYDAEAVRVPSDGWHGKVRPTLAPEDAERQSGNDRTERPSANLRNVWKIATAKYKGAHFATFPPKLVEPCIKAGTSEKGCCPECGAPWNRVVERTAMEIRRSERTHDFGRTRSSGTMTKAPTSETTGWAPTCEHDTDPIPCTVLDPFGGAGTVGLVTEALGRDSTLIEISGKYAKMSRNRIVDSAPLFARVTVE